MRYKGLWLSLALVMVVSFAILGYYGVEIYRQAPPVPEKVQTEEGNVVFTGDEIRRGQNVWQSIGGQELGSIWGHGAYVAPDWSADWLHREAVHVLDAFARADHGKEYSQLANPEKAALRERLKANLRSNTFDPASKTVTITEERRLAIEENVRHYTSLFGNDPRLQALRDAYAVKLNTVIDPQRLRDLNAFFFWTSWACVTERPGQAISYTNNWPSEALVGNTPSGALMLWSVVSFVLLLAGVAALAWYYAVQRRKAHADVGEAPLHDPLLALSPTPSMKATLKYFWVVTALIVAQVGFGVVAAHYGVEGSAFYGIPIAEVFPYSVVRTWHTQLGIFWIATAWLASGLFIAPAVAGVEPRGQRSLVNFLFVCLLIIVVGSMVGQWLGVMQKLGHGTNFWLGHQGYEYVDLGRFWQLFLWAGLFIWLFLMHRAMRTTWRRDSQEKDLLALFFIASLAIPLFYTAGLMWGQHTNLATVEYWRWWVVHLWVEGFFEVFATVVIAFLFTRMKLLTIPTASTAVLFSTVIFLSGGIVGTFHHLYFSGTPTAVMALGATFSALEVVPLVLIGFEAYENLTLTRARPWVAAYRWPIYFFVAVAFWNLVGAGLFGFLINPPIALYYMQGLNTTPVHGHTALFGVYGMLGIGLMLFCLKGLTLHHVWKTKSLTFAFWAINIGLTLMVLLSVLPIGLLQTVAAVNEGYWYARSAEFTQTGVMNILRWLRVIGDTIFALGIFSLGYFVLGLKLGWSLEERREPSVVGMGGAPVA